MPTKRVKSAPQLTDLGFTQWLEEHHLEAQPYWDDRSSLEILQNQMIRRSEANIPSPLPNSVDGIHEEHLEYPSSSQVRELPSTFSSEAAGVVQRSAIEARHLSNDAIVGIATGTAGAVVGLVGAATGTAQCWMTRRAMRDKQQADIELQDFQKQQQDVVNQLKVMNQELAKRLQEQAQRAEELIRSAAKLDINKLLTSHMCESGTSTDAPILRNELDKRSDELRRLSNALRTQREDVEALRLEREARLDSREESLDSVAQASDSRSAKIENKYEAFVDITSKVGYGLVLAEILANFKSKSAEDLIQKGVKQIVDPLKKDLAKRSAIVGAKELQLVHRETDVATLEVTRLAKIEEADRECRLYTAENSKLKAKEQKKNETLDEADKLLQETRAREAALEKTRAALKAEESKTKHRFAIWRDTLERRENEVSARERKLLK